MKEKTVRKIEIIAGTGIIILGGISAGVKIYNFVTDTTDEVADVIKDNNNNANSNYSYEYTISAENTVTGETEINYPVTIEGKAEVTDDTMHGTANLDMPNLGIEDNDVETYSSYDGESSFVSSKWTTESEWQSRNTEGKNYHALFNFNISELPETAFEDAELKSDNEKYTITLNAAGIAKTGITDVLSGDNGLFTKIYGSNLTGEDIRNGFSDGEGTFIFDKETGNLETINIDNLNGSYTVQVGETDYAVNIKIDMNMNIKDYGKTADVSIPEEIQKLEQEQKQNESTILEGDYGSYNGTELESPVSWELFGNDGWKQDTSVDETGYSFVTYLNDKYPEYRLFLFGKNLGDVSHDDIVNEGSYGYSIVQESETDAVVPVTWRGKTIGCSREEIVDVYGDPELDSGDEGNMRTISYSPSSDSSIDFKFVDNKLTEVSMYVSG